MGGGYRGSNDANQTAGLTGLTGLTGLREPTLLTCPVEHDTFKATDSPNLVE